MAKAQLLPFAFLIFLVAATMIGYIFFNTYYGTRFKIQELFISIADAIANVAQTLKNYLSLSLSYSSQQSLREHACVGGTIGAAPWIVNGPNPVPVEKSKECLEKYTLFYFNEYFGLFNSSLPVDISRINYTLAIYGIDADGVFSGLYDEGLFWVNSTDGALIVSGVNRNVTAVESLDTNNFVTKNRYWYMFRHFYAWAENDVYSPCMCSIIGCSCGTGAAATSCTSCSGPTRGCAESALNDLQNRFDDDVQCRMDRLCCQQGTGPACLPPSPCLAWETTTCLAKSEHDCIEPSIGKKPCPVKVAESGTTSLAAEKSSLSYVNPSQKELISFSPDNCWYQGRVSAGYKYTCQDFKYYVPSDKGPVPLDFSVTAYAFWKDNDVCQCAGDIC